VETALHLIFTRSLRLAASYTWNDFVFVDDGLDNADFEGNELPGVPPHRLFARLSWSPSSWFLDLEGEHASAYYAADSNVATSKNPAATVFDVRFGGTQRLGNYSMRPFVGINNLTDERYFSSVVINAAGARYFETAPGRNFYFGLGIAMGNWP
jgi:iron complex outermembrane receptor protein